MKRYVLPTGKREITFRFTCEFEYPSCKQNMDSLYQFFETIEGEEHDLLSLKARTKNFLADGLKNYLTSTGQMFEVAKSAVGLIDGKPNDPEHRQPCPIPGCQSGDDAFYFCPDDGTFHCQTCGFIGDIVDLYSRVMRNRPSDAVIVVPETNNKGVEQVIDTNVTMQTDDSVKGSSRGGRPPVILDNAKKWLKDFLTSGSKTCKRIMAKAKTKGDSKTTLQRAKKELGIKSKQEWCPATGKNQWVWELPSTPDMREDLPQVPGCAKPICTEKNTESI